jgi:hypothetical protein
VGVKGQDVLLLLWPGAPGQAEPLNGRIPAAYAVETRHIRKAVDTVQSG